MQYSRKNFLFPSLQPPPHSSFGAEVSTLRDAFPEGSPYVLGPLDGDHWYVFIAEYSERADSEDQMLNVYMHDLDVSAANQFFRGPSKASAAAVTQNTGIGRLVPGSVVHDWLFEPCGYSMNGLLNESYWTVHVTPESHCSYASFETNIAKSSYRGTIEDVISIFKCAPGCRTLLTRRRPKRFQTITFTDALSPMGMDTNRSEAAEGSSTLTPAAPVSIDGYAVVNASSNQFQPGHLIQLVNYRRL